VLGESLCIPTQVRLEGVTTTPRYYIVYFFFIYIFIYIPLPMHTTNTHSHTYIMCTYIHETTQQARSILSPVRRYSTRAQRVSFKFNSFVVAHAYIIYL